MGVQDSQSGVTVRRVRRATGGVVFCKKRGALDERGGKQEFTFAMIAYTELSYGNLVVVVEGDDG